MSRRRTRTKAAPKVSPAPQEPNRSEYIPIVYGPGSTLGDALALAKGGGSAPRGEYQDIPVTSLQRWNVNSIRAALANHELGVFTQSSSLVESLLGDPRIQSAVNGRLKGITRCDVVVEAPKGAADKLAEQIRQELEDLYGEVLDETTLDQLLCWSVFMGFGLAEKIWELDDETGRVKPRLKVWHPMYCYYRIDVRKYVALTVEGQIEIEENDPKWFLFTPWGSYRGWLRGAVRGVAIPWMVRMLALRDMARFSEKHGLPMILLEVPAQSDATDKARLMAQARGLGADAVALLPQQGGSDGAGYKISLLEAKDTAWEAFPGLIEICERDILLAIRGTNLTSEVDGGSRAASETHADEDSDYAASDRRKFASAVRQQIFEPYVTYNYGRPDLVPSLTYVSPETNQKEQAETLDRIANAIDKLEQRGWPIDRESMANTFGVPLLPPDPASKKEDTTAVVLAPTDLASVLTVNEARASAKLGPLLTPDGAEDPNGKLTIEDFRALKAKPANDTAGQPANDNEPPPKEQPAPKDLPS